MARTERHQEDPVETTMSAAMAGRPDALYELGLLYSTGRAGYVDYIQAHKWFNLAALRGVERAKADRAEVASEMSAVEIEEAQRQAREWLTRN